jgi:hypothetical protein
MTRDRVNTFVPASLRAAVALFYAGGTWGGMCAGKNRRRWEMQPTFVKAHFDFGMDDSNPPDTYLTPDA